jgi:cation diffusion facilitator CzcD-associated flavoprotein CzcO
VEHFDVVVVGAGISGIGAGYFLQRDCPGRSFVILEGREAIGGTWDLFRYPGVRSDSDMHTLGYSFKPWTAEKSIADGPAILEYLNETADEFHLREKIRFGHHVNHAHWSSETSTWTVTAKTGGATVQYTCNFLFMCSGYYSYTEGYTPEIAGMKTFGGTVIHPQKWPENFDYSDKRVVVIGSGATAMTLVPAMARTASHVVMLQRSPTYVVARPDRDKIASLLRRIFPEKVAYSLTRWKNTTMQQLVYSRTRKQPKKVKELLLKGVRDALGDDFDVDTHFTPTYNPWDQRLCLVPNGDLFEAIKNGSASVVTDHIDSVDENGIRLASGGRVDADIIVTATGLNLVTLGQVSFVVDGEPVDFSSTWSYKGCSYSGVPNLASSFGYINASWTLRADLTCEYVCRLLNHMEQTGTTQCTPRLRPEDLTMEPRPWIDNFSAGYMQRVMDQFPRQGDREPWINPQNYKRDKKLFRESPIEDGVMTFSRALQGATGNPPL